MHFVGLFFSSYIEELMAVLLHIGDDSKVKQLFFDTVHSRCKHVS